MNIWNIACRQTFDHVQVLFNREIKCFTLSGLSFYGQLLEQLNVASLSRPTVCLQCYSLLLLYFGQINDDDDDNDEDNDDDDQLFFDIIR